MTGPISHDLNRLEFDTVHDGDVLQITTGVAEAAWQYSFDVERAGHWPKGTLSALTPSGEVTEPAEFALHGCGRWTSRRENPVQSMERGFTPYYKGLIVGSFLFGRFPAETDRAVFDKPGQEIQTILHTPYRTNIVASVLRSDERPLSVREVTEQVEASGKIPLSNKDVRATLTELISQKKVKLLRGKVQVFALDE